MTRKSAVVTGGAGFIGSHVVDALLGEGMEVTVVDDLSSGSERHVSDAATLEVADIADRDALDAAIDPAAPSAIYHVAAQSSVTASVADPARDCAVNVQGTLHVLEAATRHRVPLVFTSTGGALYGNDAPLPTPEDRLPAPVAPYGASKWAAEAYVTTWSIASGLPHAVLRLGNVYGPRQNPHGEAGVVAIFSHRLWRGEPPTVYGHGRPTRDYVHVTDVVDAVLRACGTAGIFNVATGAETDVLTLLGHLQRAAGTALEPAHAALRPGELERSCMDPGRASATLGWRARIGLEEGLASTYRSLVAEFESAESGSTRPG
ncbi:MAG: NAD-dependent epimerase/dehydratase family protein [Solirubrobacteraceae bacterium]|jgi:UDP-glucose 4-epimerase